MTGKLFQDTDGARAAAQAVLAYLRKGHIDQSWCDRREMYLAEPTVARWHNCREQGYVVSLRNKALTKQINIAFFEHRNSDSICAVVFEASTVNPPTLADIPAGVYARKWDVSHTVAPGEAIEMADWILKTLSDFWVVQSD